MGIAAFFLIVLVVPMVLGWLASGRRKVHRGSTLCAGCRYELEGLDLDALPDAEAAGDASQAGRRCPECGVLLTRASVLRDGRVRYKPPSKIISFAVIAILMLPLVALLQWAGSWYLGLGTGARAMAWLAYPCLVGGLFVLHSREQDKLAKMHDQLSATRERTLEEYWDARSEMVRHQPMVQNMPGRVASQQDSHTKSNS